ncbi:serine/threonine-protein kinase ppk6 [Metarhizium rileyi]|uniref:Serine/threonine-protein kinase ppk6 n=1 Tax=Metarhizium rileyi (strain RCEF 4871) TaxID=1649241 RepID=A0A166VTF7_METRR|nr:serine/threonine-protein kinase ppk6 [Metarhizium rileyi RCEF 4871]
MSADLFAEFRNNSASPPPLSQSSNRLGHSTQQEQTKKQAQTEDPFNFSGRNGAVPAHQSGSQWSSFCQSTPSSLNGWHQPMDVALQKAGDDDVWGDFEVAQSTEAPATPEVYTQPPVSGSIGWDSYSASEPGPHHFSNNAAQVVANNSTGAAGIGGFRDFDPQADWNSQSVWPRAEPTQKVQVKSAASNPNVLFDADDFELQGGEENVEDLDEFGDFETVVCTPRSDPVPSTTPQRPSSLDLLGLDDPPMFPPRKETSQDILRQQPRPAPVALSLGAMPSNPSSPPQPPVYESEYSLAEPEVKKPTHTSTYKANSKPVYVSSSKLASAARTVPSAKVTANDDEWGAWDDFSEDTGVNHASRGSDTNSMTDTWAQGVGDDGGLPTAMTDDSSPPPMNVPPPSILLSTFPELFNTGNSLFDSLAGQSPSFKQHVLSNTKTIRFLQGYVLLGATAARVIAGRKHRWHRDKVLAKSMSISAAGSKGMKLASVDKQQSAREDREAADVVAAWREHIGKLRSAVATANSAGKANIKVPELAEKPQIQTAKMVPTAPKPCIICGLKREERVSKVDLEVEDSFGEWWVEHWGHRACKNFWIEHEQLLRQR